MKNILLAALRGYQYILSPWFGTQCRFYPTCSEYAHIAIVRHGPWRGGWMALTRLCKCHPWHEGGADPVP